MAEESAKARERQREHYNNRAKEFNYKVGDRVFLDIRVVKTVIVQVEIDSARVLRRAIRILFLKKHFHVKFFSFTVTLVK